MDPIDIDWHGNLYNDNNEVACLKVVCKMFDNILWALWLTGFYCFLLFIDFLCYFCISKFCQRFHGLTACIFLLH